MKLRRAYQVAAVVWAAVGLTIALPAVPPATGDARLVIGAASLLFPLSAVLAAVALARGRDRLAGLLLVVSAASPTYFAAALNLPALIVGLLLLIRGRVSLRTARDPSRSGSSGPAS